MCNLDIIAGPMSDEMIFHQWLYSSLNDPGFVTALVIFGAVFVMLLSIVTLFVVMLVKRHKEKSPIPAVEPDGSIHTVPFICSVAASVMFIFGAFTVLLTGFWSGMLGFYWTYTTAGIYAAVMAILFGVALYFSPRSSKSFKFWNTGCLVATILFVFFVIYFRLFIWFARGSVEVLG